MLTKINEVIILEIISFIVYSDFGIFKKPDVNLSYLTYEFIPKPMVLGILGAIAGFSGWNTQEEVPEYYRKLENLRIGIEPLKLAYPDKPPYNSSHFSPRAGVGQKTFVTYNNYHGYGNERANLIIKEQIHIKPAYRIFIEKNRCPKELIEALNIETKIVTPTYSPYMGKNEFLLSVILEKEKDAESLTEEKTKVDTVFFSEILKKDNIAQERGESVAFYNIYENYPYKLDGSHYLYKKVIYSNRRFEIDYSKISDTNYFLVNINGTHVFFF